MKIILFALLLCFTLALPVGSDVLNLFFIQRSKNNNEVHYQLHVDEACQIVPEKPITASWRLLEERSKKTASLSAVDRMAYGITNQHLENNWLFFNLNALDTRLIRATAIYDAKSKTCLPIVQTKIHKKWATLHHIYVQSDEGFLIPSVDYIDIFGQSLDSIPRQVVERVEN